MYGKCPNCQKHLPFLQSSAIDVKDGSRSWKGAVFMCPYCYTAVGAGIDPVALKADTVSETVEEVTKEIKKILLGLRR